MSTPEERFEKWWQTVPCEYTDVVTEDVGRAAYLAATEDAARIAKECWGNSHSIAKAIRGK